MIRNVIITAFIGAALASCTNDSPEHNEALQVECYSRSANEKKVVEDFGMYVLTSSGTAYPGVSNPVHVTYQSPGWNFSPILLSEDAQIYSFSPYTETTDCSALNINLNNQTDYLASAAISASKSNPSISITMKHILSKINVTIDGSSSCQVKLLNVPNAAMYN